MAFRVTFEDLLNFIVIQDQSVESVKLFSKFS